jgi:Na+/H+ antiporter NhaD/arsenite permease-like protein
VLANKLPVALLAGVSLAAVDLGPNLAVSGSLATLLWLRALRHEGIVVTPALIGAVLVVH